MLNEEKAILSSISMEGVNQQIEIYTGEYTLDIDGNKVVLEGNILMKWLPDARIEYKGKVVEGYKEIERDLLTVGSGKSKVFLETSNGFYGQAMINKVNFKHQFNISGVVLRHIEKINDVKMDSLKFNVVNFLDSGGQRIIHEKKNYSGRMVFNYKDYKIIVDKLHNFKQIYEDLNESGGYAVTHAGSIENIKGEQFSFEDVEGLLETLGWLLSFASGRQVGICSYHGYCKKDKVLERFQSPIIAKWKNHTNWFSRLNSQGSLESIYPSLVEKLNNELWGDVLKRTFTWYFDSMVSTYIENKIVSVQIALEMLAWTYIVEENEIIDKKIFDSKLRASDKLRLLLYEFSIPREIPDIECFKTFNSYKDGAHLFTDFRNEIVHPKKVKDKGEMTSTSKYYILQLGRKYLELSILRILGYEGMYQNLVSNKKWLGESLEKVPWCPAEIIK